MTADLFFFAGEPSGDAEGAELLMALKKENPDLTCLGVGGPKMREQGLECIIPMEEFSVMGFFDLLPALPRLIRHFRTVKRHILQCSPKAAIFIDYPGFNLRLAAALRKKGCQAKNIQYVCPSVWAWGKGRVAKINRSMDTLLTLLPFEAEIFHNGPVDAHYVGHPVIERMTNHVYERNWRSFYKIPPRAPIFALFPGSREKEITRNLPLQLEVASKLAQDFPDLQFVISCATSALRPFIEKELSDPFPIIEPTHSYEVMRDAEVAVATSGTVTLELALHEVPTVVTYAARLVDVFLARHLLRIRLPYYCLPNIIAQKLIFPELFGPMLTKKTLEQKLRDYLISECNRQATIEGCSMLKAALGSKKASEQAAKTILFQTQIGQKPQVG